MPKPKHDRDGKAWEKIKNQMDDLENAVPLFKNIAGFAEDNTESLFYAFEGGRTAMLEKMDKLIDLMKEEIRSSFQQKEISVRQVTNYENAINTCDMNCKKIINKDLVDKPRVYHDFKNFGIGSHRDPANQQPDPSSSDKKPRQ